MLGEQINTHGIGNQSGPCQNCPTYEQQIKELLTRNAELEKSIKGQNVLEELLSQYAKSQTQNLRNANTEWDAETQNEKHRESSFESKNHFVLLSLFFLQKSCRINNSKKSVLGIISRKSFQRKNLI